MFYDAYIFFPLLMCAYNLLSFLFSKVKCPSKIEEATYWECESCFDNTFYTYVNGQHNCRCSYPYVLNTEGTECVRVVCPPGEYVDAAGECKQVLCVLI